MGCRLFFFVVLNFLASAVSAADGLQFPSDSLLWRCWYDQQAHITCLLDRAPQTEIAFIPEIPVNAPPVAKTIWTNPGSLRDKIVHIPLLTPPLDMEFTAVLAKSMVCGARRDCSVNFTSSLPPAEEIIALLGNQLQDLEDGAAALAMLNSGLYQVE